MAQPGTRRGGLFAELNLLAVLYLFLSPVIAPLPALDWADMTGRAQAQARDAKVQPASYAYWTLHPEGADVRLTIPLAMLAPSLNTGVGAFTLITDQIADTVQLLDAGTPCKRRAPAQEQSFQDEHGAAWVTLSQQLRCPHYEGNTLPHERVIAVAAAPLLSLGRYQHARIDPLVGPALDHVFTAQEPRFPLPPVHSFGFLDRRSHAQRTLQTTLRDPQLFFLSCALLLLSTRVGQRLWTFGVFLACMALALYAATADWLNPSPVNAACLGFMIAFTGLAHAYREAESRRIPLLLAVGLLALMGARDGQLSTAALAGLLSFGLCHLSLLRRAPQRRPPTLPLAWMLASVLGLLYGLRSARLVSDWAAAPTETLTDVQLGTWIGLALASTIFVAMLNISQAVAGLLRGEAAATWVGRSLAAVATGGGLFWLVVGHFS